ncbi:hypothetical protein I6H07_06160 [Hafnia alvei]|nr:hypothetical protein [Hafnia alvei]MBI0275418.1 hypothetical protein [Hafnia alvei]PNK98589.1 hypothetical protein CEQ28_013840 [Hafnia alvei]
MPVQNFSINTKSGYAGDLYGITHTNSQRNTYIADDNSVSYGVAVNETSSRRCKAGINTNGILTGVAIRTLNNEAATRPSDGSVFFRSGDAIAVMEEGYIQVMVDTAVTKDGDVYIDPTDGSFHTTAGTSNVLAVNAIYYLDAPAGDVAVVWVEKQIAPKS